jgi:hypothetical protein
MKAVSKFSWSGLKIPRKLQQQQKNGATGENSYFGLL